MFKATNNHKSSAPRKRKTSNLVVPSVCDMDNARKRQSTIVNFFGGQPAKRVVSPQTPLRTKTIDILYSEPTDSTSTRKNMISEQHLNTHTRRPKSQNTNKKSEQLYLDLGQSSFGKQTECRHCGTLYVHGVREDRQAHERVCRDFREGVFMRVTPALKSSKDIVSLGQSKFMLEVRTYFRPFLSFSFSKKIHVDTFPNFHCFCKLP